MTEKAQDDGFSPKRDLGLDPLRPYFDGVDSSTWKHIPSPSFVVDTAALQHNLDILADVAKASGASILAALKAFSMFSEFPRIAAALGGACTSGINEALLAREYFGGDIHVYSPAYTEADLEQLLEFCSHLVFNSVRQWHRHRDRCLAAARRRPELSFGIRINPEHREAEVELYDPSAPLSRLGTTRRQWDADCAELGYCSRIPDGISGIHFHVLCEQDSFALERVLSSVATGWGDVLSSPQIAWLNMGGGHHITSPGYDRDHLVSLVRKAAADFAVAVILEPGEAIAVHTGVLRASVLDVHRNDVNIALLDVSATCHMPDTLEMPYTANIWGARALEAAPEEYDPRVFRLGGPSCLAGDIIGNYRFKSPLSPGREIILDDMSHYTIVKTTTFNGVGLPALGTWDPASGFRLVRSFGYEDFKSRLS